MCTSHYFVPVLFCYLLKLKYLCNMIVKQFFRKFASWHLWLNLLGMVALIVVALVGLKWWLLGYTHHGESIEVPDLYGKDYRVALEEVENLGLRIDANDSTYIKDMPGGCVVVQSPAKGMHVKEGRTIYVTINSLTIPRVRIPDLAGNSSYRQALATLQALEFRVQQPKLIDGDKDWVYGLQDSEGHNLHAGDMVARESQIILIIGNGSNDEYDYYDESEDIGDEDTDSEAADEVDDFEPVDMDLLYD